MVTTMIITWTVYVEIKSMQSRSLKEKLHRLLCGNVVPVPPIIYTVIVIALHEIHRQRPPLFFLIQNSYNQQHECLLNRTKNFKRAKTKNNIRTSGINHNSLSLWLIPH
jgi:hypothetical protein